MSWWDQFLSRETRERHHHNGAEEALEMEVQQPFSDGSEEFFQEFMPRDDRHGHANRQVLIGLGITAGVLAGVGIAVWLKKGKRPKGFLGRKTWRDFLARK
jgi:hypothetical protein